jgi:hypothetical protein
MQHVVSLDAQSLFRQHAVRNNPHLVLFELRNHHRELTLVAELFLHC